MHRDKLKRILASIYAVETEELICSTFFEQLPRYADLQRAGKDARNLLPDVHHHLHQCPECDDVYRALLAIEPEAG
jgi:hypothetical protein